MKQPTSMKEATTMVKERWLDRRVEKLSKDNDRLREELDELRHDLDQEQTRSKETLQALSKARRRPGRVKWLVLAGGAYVLGAKAGRARYEQVRGWARSLMPNGRDEAETPDTMTTTPTATGVTTKTTSPKPPTTGTTTPPM